jgi:hypothetical protein
MVNGTVGKNFDLSGINDDSRQFSGFGFREN